MVDSCCRLQRFLRVAFLRHAALRRATLRYAVSPLLHRARRPAAFLLRRRPRQRRRRRGKNLCATRLNASLSRVFRQRGSSSVKRKTLLISRRRYIPRAFNHSLIAALNLSPLDKRR